MPRQNRAHEIRSVHKRPTPLRDRLTKPAHKGKACVKCQKYWQRSEFDRCPHCFPTSCLNLSTAELRLYGRLKALRIRSPELDIILTILQQGIDNLRAKVVSHG